jgi:acetylornithine deacetylase/succinyl-diaminopimelate desuccinylase-like protein
MRKVVNSAELRRFVDSAWEPVIRDGGLYGRGAADDGYAVFSSLTAIAALEAHRHAKPRRLPRCGDRGLRALLAHDLAARQRGRHAGHSGADRRGAFGGRQRDSGVLFRCAEAAPLAPRKRGHGPNEFLHIDYAKRLTAEVAQVIARHARE